MGLRTWRRAPTQWELMGGQQDRRKCHPSATATSTYRGVGIARRLLPFEDGYSQQAMGRDRWQLKVELSKPLGSRWLEYSLEVPSRQPKQLLQLSARSRGHVLGQELEPGYAGSIQAPSHGMVAAGPIQEYSRKVHRCAPENSALHFALAPARPPRLPLKVAVVKPANE